MNDIKKAIKEAMKMLDIEYFPTSGQLDSIEEINFHGEDGRKLIWSGRQLKNKINVRYCFGDLQEWFEIPSRSEYFRGKKDPGFDWLAERCCDRIVKKVEERKPPKKREVWRYYDKYELAARI